MTIVTLTSDFGVYDGFVSVMKGVILGIAPQARLVDITHGIPPQDVKRAAWLLQTVAPYFPPGTVHLVVVDPGVGSERRPLAVRSGETLFVGPDNGLFTTVLAEGEVYHLDRPEFWLSQPSQTFHGRDIFAPVAGRLAAGIAVECLGTRVNDPVRLSLPQPMRLVDGILAGEVIYVDHFGNLITNLPGAWFTEQSRWQFEIAQYRVMGLMPSYADVEPGALLALVSSSGHVEIACRNSNAARLLNVGEGTQVRARPLAT